MAAIFTRISKDGYTKYYGNLTVNSTRIKKYLDDNPKSARIALKKLEYELIFNPSKYPKHKDIPLNHAIISFLKEAEVSGVSDHRVQT